MDPPVKRLSSPDLKEIGEFVQEWSEMNEMCFSFRPRGRHFSSSTWRTRSATVQMTGSPSTFPLRPLIRESAHIFGLLILKQSAALLYFVLVLLRGWLAGCQWQVVIRLYCSKVWLRIYTTYVLRLDSIFTPISTNMSADANFGMTTFWLICIVRPAWCWLATRHFASS